MSPWHLNDAGALSDVVGESHLVVDRKGTVEIGALHGDVHQVAVGIVRGDFLDVGVHFATTAAQVLVAVVFAGKQDPFVDTGDPFDLFQRGAVDDDKVLSGGVNDGHVDHFLSL